MEIGSKVKVKTTGETGRIVDHIVYSDITENIPNVFGVAMDVPNPDCENFYEYVETELELL